MSLAYLLAANRPASRCMVSWGLDADEPILLEKRPAIIAMTAIVMAGDRELTGEAGIDDYVAKPIRVEELTAALSRVKTN